MSNEIEGFFNGGGPALKFPVKGTSWTLTLTEEPEVTQQTNFDSGELEFWPDGKPKMQMILRGTVPANQREDDEDDGERRLFVKSGLVKALRQAMRTAKVKAPAPGGVLTVVYVKDGPKPARGYPAKVYEASYVPPVPRVRVSAENFLGGSDEGEPKKGPIAREVEAAKRKMRAAKAAAAAADSDDAPY